jgi:hypothetical protein
MKIKRNAQIMPPKTTLSEVREFDIMDSFP